MLLHLLVLAPFVAAILMVLNSKEDYKAATHMAILFGLVFLGMSLALVSGGNIATSPVEWLWIPGCKGPSYYYLYSHGLGSWMVFLSCGKGGFVESFGQFKILAQIDGRAVFLNNIRAQFTGLFARLRHNV